MDSTILKVKVWVSAGETRIYVETFRGEYEMRRGDKRGIRHEGCRYVSGNSWHPKGSQDGDLTAEEWKMARAIAFNRESKQWADYYVPRYDDILRPPVVIAPVEPAAVIAPVQAVEQRKVLALTVGSSTAIGAFTIITERGDMKHERDQVLVCIDCGYVPEDDENTGGWYSSYAEPTATEQQSPEYQRLIAQVDSDRAYEQRQYQIIADRRQHELDAIRAEGREPTLFEDLFAGTSDN